MERKGYKLTLQNRVLFAVREAAAPEKPGSPQKAKGSLEGSRRPKDAQGHPERPTEAHGGPGRPREAHRGSWRPRECRKTWSRTL